MKTYPSITSFFAEKTLIGNKVFAFNKYDGSNFRAEWNFKQRNSPAYGFTKFGTRTQLIDSTNKEFGEAVKIFKDKYAEPINEILSTRSKRSAFIGVDRITVFLEFFGENSFAGFHPDEPKDLYLFDVFLEKKGFLIPQVFLELFSNKNINIPELIYEGNLNMDFANSIKANDWTKTDAKYPTVKEGVVCKYGDLMTKIKTQWWINKLKNTYPEEFDELL